MPSCSRCKVERDESFFQKNDSSGILYKTCRDCRDKDKVRREKQATSVEKEKAESAEVTFRAFTVAMTSIVFSCKDIHQSIIPLLCTLTNAGHVPSQLASQLLYASELEEFCLLENIRNVVRCTRNANLINFNIPMTSDIIKYYIESGDSKNWEQLAELIALIRVMCPKLSIILESISEFSYYNFRMIVNMDIEFRIGGKKLILDLTRLNVTNKEILSSSMYGTLLRLGVIPVIEKNNPSYKLFKRVAKRVVNQIKLKKRYSYFWQMFAKSFSPDSAERLRKSYIAFGLSVKGSVKEEEYNSLKGFRKMCYELSVKCENIEKRDYSSKKFENEFSLTEDSIAEVPPAFVYEVEGENHWWWFDIRNLRKMIDGGMKTNPYNQRPLDLPNIEERWKFVENEFISNDLDKVKQLPLFDRIEFYKRKLEQFLDDYYLCMHSPIMKVLKAVHDKNYKRMTRILCESEIPVKYSYMIDYTVRSADDYLEQVWYMCDTMQKKNCLRYL